VLPFKAAGDNPDLVALADGISEEIVTGLSRFSYLRVMARGPEARDPSYVIEGSLRKAGKKLRLAVQLVDATTGAHLWAETYERPFNPEAAFELQDDLAPRIVATVGDAHGILPHTMSESLRGRAPDELTPYEAVLRAFGQGFRRTSEEHATVRACLDRAVEEAPRYSDAWAMLALTYVDEQTHGYNQRPDSLDRALEAARRAVDAAPSNALAYHALAWTMFFRKEHQAFRAAAEQSIALNPLNSPTLAGLGALTAYSGDWESGCALVGRALELNPRHPGWYWFPLFYNAYRKTDYRDAVNLALKFNLPDFFVTHEALAAAYGQLGELEAAGKALREMLRLKPDYDSTGGERLEKWFDPEFVEHLTDGLRKAGLEVPAPETAASAIAVLPFKDMSQAKDQEYLCEGMAEEIMNALTRLQGLRVIARTSAFRFRGEQDLRKVGEALGVGMVLEGSVRRAGQRLRITAQLVDVADDSHIWSERFDREMTDVFEIQDEIAGAIVEKLHLSLGAAEPARRPTANVKAYEALLEGRHNFSQFTPEAAERALACLQLSLSLEPDYPDALVLYAFYHVMLAYMFDDPRVVLPNARALAERALKLDPNHGEAQATVATAVILMDWDWSAGETLFRRALVLAPASARVHELYGLVGLLARGRLDEALAELDRAVELDPLSALYAGNRGRVLTCSRRFAEAEETCRRGLALDPGQLLAQVELIYALTFQRRFDEAVVMGRRAIESHGRTKAVLNALAVSLALAGERDEARQLLNDDAEPGSGAYRSPLTLGLVHAACSEMDAAFECVQRAIDEKDPILMYLRVHPMFDALRADPRFPELLLRTNLLEGDQP
jgi:TolB-like protein/Tfp pilus assembly protein PilF